MVVFPAPFGPSKANTSPRFAVNVTPVSTSLVPYLIRRSRTSSAIAGVSLLESIAVSYTNVVYILHTVECRCKLV